MEHNYRIRYKNVSLFPLRTDDIELLRIWRNDPGNSAYLRKIPFITPENQQKWYCDYLKNSDEMIFSIYENSELNRVVGSLSLYNFDDRSCFFGKILIGDNEAHGKHVGLNATKGAVKVGFDILDLSKIYLNVYSENKRAIKVYEQAGFIPCGSHKCENELEEITMMIEK